MWFCGVMYITGTCGRLWSSIKIVICEFPLNGKTVMRIKYWNLKMVF